VVRASFRDDDLKEALRQAHPGIFDVRSWAYWHLMLDEQPVPPLPTRQFPDEDRIEVRVGLPCES
jgi:hypothetical protein